MARFIQKLTREEAVAEALKLAATSLLQSEYRPTLADFVEFGFALLEQLDLVQFRDPKAVPERPLEDLSDRELSNVLHGRQPDDNGEFTASSMGAAQDRLRNDIAKGGG